MCLRCPSCSVWRGGQGCGILARMNFLGESSRAVEFPRSSLLRPARRGILIRFLAAAVLATAWTANPGRAGDAADAPRGTDSWGGRRALPVVVNPVVRSPLQTSISLRGEWEFVTQDVAPLRHPAWRAFYAKP